uniref:Avh176 n=1 Tax=Phytophthora sojae TaxID=67593 RepID=G1FRV0_PHYSO|nr:Avh176 [Phytophthora sojae]AEK80838.1 Avh176 [Phytophthora sojae]
MRAVFVFVLLALLACCNGIASAESVVKVNALQADAVEAPVDSAITRRRLRGTVAEEEERILGLEKLANRVTSLFKTNPGLAQKAENLQKSPSAVKALEKATLSEKGSGKLRAYFARLSANSSKQEKFFIIATILLFIAGVGVTWLS